MARQGTEITTEMGWSTPDRITVRGRDLVRDVLGKIDLGQMAFLEVTGRLPTPQEGVVFNAIAVTLVEHGITPSALASRLTYLGAPESMQAAVAAGLCGLGSVFVGSTEAAAEMLRDALPEPKLGSDLKKIASELVASFKSRKQIIPGLGHPIHKPIDPRTPRLFQIAQQNGFSGQYVELIKLVSEEAEKASGKQLPINATGALAAICCELGLSPMICRGIAVMARAIGLVGHLVEESKKPMARELWLRTEREATRHIRDE